MDSSALRKLPRRVARRVRRELPTVRARLRAIRAAAVAPVAPPPASPRKPGPPKGLPQQDIDSPEVLHEFWRQPAPEGNNPHDYIGPIGRSKVLLELISDLPKDARILEVGCNVGRNLAYLYDHGYTDVEGIEISPHAVELLRQTYPQLAEVTIHLGAAEELLPKLTDAFDLVYTMAVVEHIHPDSSVVFDEMVRLGSSILSIEPPGRRSHRQHPHDVPEIFRSRGMTLVSERPMTDFPETRDDKGIRIFIAYRFTRAGKPEQPDPA